PAGDAQQGGDSPAGSCSGVICARSRALALFGRELPERLPLRYPVHNSMSGCPEPPAGRRPAVSSRAGGLSGRAGEVAELRLVDDQRVPCARTDDAVLRQFEPLLEGLDGL